MVPVASVWVPRAPTYSGSRSPPLRISSTGFAPSVADLSMPFDYLFSITCRGPTTPALCWFGLLRFRSPLLSESLLFSSPPGTKMFQFPGLPSLKLCIGLRMIKLFNFIGFPHSDTPGSLPVYDSPRRFAVICVLLLLYMPRHPPYALTNLITYIRLCFTRTVNYFVLDFFS